MPPCGYHSSTHSPVVESHQRYDIDDPESGVNTVMLREVDPMNRTLLQSPQTLLEDVLATHRNVFGSTIDIRGDIEKKPISHRDRRFLEVRKDFEPAALARGRNTREERRIPHLRAVLFALRCSASII